MSKLTFEEWKQHFKIDPVDAQLIREMKELHNVDAYPEIEKALQQEYQNYLEQPNE